MEEKEVRVGILRSMSFGTKKLRVEFSNLKGNNINNFELCLKHESIPTNQLNAVNIRINELECMEVSLMPDFDVAIVKLSSNRYYFFFTTTEVGYTILVHLCASSLSKIPLYLRVNDEDLSVD